jgi:DNA-binding SARP family transcriptional activator
VLEIALLGGFSMRTKGQVVTVHLSRAARWVLAYLALDPHHEADRIRLAHLFWPDSSEHQARTNLRKTLSELRHVPPIAPLLAMSHGRVALADGGWTVDVRRFLAAAESVSLPRLTEAVDVYRGDLLPEDDAEWLLPERGRLRLLYLQTLDRLVDLLGSRGEWAEAQRYADRAVSHDPWYEGGWLRLFRTLAAQKDGSGIERAWRQLSTLWQREMDEDPPRTLAAAYLAARESIVPADNPALLDTAWRERWQQRVRRLFVGRQAERQRFEDWLADPDARVLTVWGPGGIGKTTLLQMLASRAAETGRIVVWLDGHEMQPQPASFLASIRPGRPADVWGWLEKTSPLIFIDSLEAVVPLADWIARRFLPRLVSSARLVVASRYTPAMLWPPDVPWRQTAWAWELTGWSREEVMEYLARRGVTDPAHVDGIWQLCQGHPLAVALAADAAATDRGQIPLGDRLRRDIIPVLADHLLRDLPTPSMRRLVEAAAVVRLVDLSLLRVLAAVLEVPLSEVPAVWRLLMRSAAFAAAPRGLRWHDDVRSFVAAHFRWEDPDAAAGVEDAAWSYLADRLRQAAADEREALLAETPSSLGSCSPTKRSEALT